LWRCTTAPRKTKRAEISRASEILGDALRDVSEKEREALRRFYVLEQSPEQICRELSLSHGQFLEIKKSVRAEFSKHRAARMGS
jgi:DNA-directed RNA polymerase specialized sigma24 family protein